MQALFSGGPNGPSAAQAGEAVAAAGAAGVPQALVVLLYDVTPEGLMEQPSGCADPSCADDACGPSDSSSQPVTPMVLMALNMTTSLAMQSRDSEMQEEAYKELVDASIADALVELVGTAAAVLRGGSSDPMAIAGADWALGVALDTLAYLVQWVLSGGPNETGGDEDDAPTHPCLILAKQLDGMGFVPMACGLNEALTAALGNCPEAVSMLRTRGTDAMLMRVVQVWAVLDQVAPETGIDIATSPVLFDCVYRALVRTSLKQGAKLPPSAASASGSASAPPPHGLPPTAELKPHWARQNVCLGILNEAVRTACVLLRGGLSSAALVLISVNTAQVALAILKLAAGTKASAAKGDACVGCVLMNLALNAGMLVTDVTVLLPRKQLHLLSSDVTGLLVVFQVKTMGRALGLPGAITVGDAGDDCGSGEMDWALADTMLGLLLYAGGAPDTVLRGRLQRTAGFDRGAGRAAPRTGAPHPLLHSMDGAAAAAGAGAPRGRGGFAPLTLLAPGGAEMPVLAHRRVLRCVEALLRTAAPAPKAAKAAAGLEGESEGAPAAAAPPPPVRAAHLACLDVAALLYGSPGAFLGADFVALAASARKFSAATLNARGSGGDDDGDKGEDEGSRGGAAAAAGGVGRDPDAIAELMLKQAHLLLSALAARAGLLPPGERDVASAASLHLLSSLASMCAWLAARAPATAPDGVSGGGDARWCAGVAAECAAAVARAACALTKLGLGDMVRASGVGAPLGALLRAALAARGAGGGGGGDAAATGQLLPSSAAAAGDGGAGGEGEVTSGDGGDGAAATKQLLPSGGGAGGDEAAASSSGSVSEAPGASAPEVAPPEVATPPHDVAACPYSTHRGGAVVAARRAAEVDGAARRAAVWGGALALLQVQVALAPGGGGAAAAAAAACELLDAATVKCMEQRFPGELAIASALAGALFLEYKVLQPLPELVAAALRAQACAPAAAAAAAGGAADGGAGALTEQLAALRVAGGGRGGGSSAATPAPAKPGCAGGGTGAGADTGGGADAGAGADAGTEALLAEWARAYSVWRAVEDAGGPAADDRSAAAAALAAGEAARSELLHVSQAAVAQKYSKHPVAAQLAMPAVSSAGDGDGDGGDGDAPSTSGGGSSKEAAPHIHGLLQLALLVEEMAGAALHTAGTHGDVASQQQQEQRQEEEGGLTLLRDEGAQTALMGGLVATALADALGQAVDADAAAGVVQQRLLALLAAPAAAVAAAGSDGDVAAGHTASQRSLLSTIVARGGFAGCCNPGCAALDKMSESGLDLKPRGAAHGAFCCDACAAV
ncbi:hypothetical protein FOA52_011764 [Chlamydomonas sp. UWO 241]|nr:hypothetical protein FOA52_011764 [Chlamydomonas sp. UWO 241]